MSCTQKDHTFTKLRTIKTTGKMFVKVCEKCDAQIIFARNSKSYYFINSTVQQKKKWAVDDTRKELLQPLTPDGNVNEEFTEAYGFNPFDERTETNTPDIQKGAKL